MKLTIRQHNRHYIEQIAERLQITPSEALNYLLLHLRATGYQPNATQSQPATQPATQSPIGFLPPITQASNSEVESIPNNSIIFDEFNPDLVEQIDPIIAKLISLGVTEEW
jgi:hypothetical protein